MRRGQSSNQIRNEPAQRDEDHHAPETTKIILASPPSA